jgi:hypothetical protein
VQLASARERLQDHQIERTGRIAAALSAAGHGNGAAALSLFEQPFRSSAVGAEVALLRVWALRRIAQSRGPTAGGKRIDRTGDLVTAKHDEEMAGAETRGLWARRVALRTIQEVTVHHHRRMQLPPGRSAIE